MNYDKCCSVLGVDMYASVQEANFIFKKLSLIRHPDKPTGSTALMQELNEAIAVFREKRHYMGEPDEQKKKAPPPKPAKPKEARDEGTRNKPPAREPSPPRRSGSGTKSYPFPFPEPKKATPKAQYTNHDWPNPPPSSKPESSSSSTTPNYRERTETPTSKTGYRHYGSESFTGFKFPNTTPQDGNKSVPKFNFGQATPQAQNTTPYRTNDFGNPFFQSSGPTPEQVIAREMRESEPLSDVYRSRIEERSSRSYRLSIFPGIDKLCPSPTCSFDAFMRKSEVFGAWLSRLLLRSVEPHIDAHINHYYRHKCAQPIKIEPWCKCHNSGMEAQLEWDAGVILELLRKAGDGDMRGDTSWIVRKLGELLNSMKWAHALNAFNSKDENRSREWKVYDLYDILQACKLHPCHVQTTRTQESPYFQRHETRDCIYCTSLTEIMWEGWSDADKRWRSRFGMGPEPYRETC